MEQNDLVGQRNQIQGEVDEEEHSVASNAPTQQRVLLTVRELGERVFLHANELYKGKEKDREVPKDSVVDHLGTVKHRQLEEHRLSYGGDCENIHENKGFARVVLRCDLRQLI